MTNQYFLRQRVIAPLAFIILLLSPVVLSQDYSTYKETLMLNDDTEIAEIVIKFKKDRAIKMRRGQLRIAAPNLISQETRSEISEDIQSIENLLNATGLPIKRTFSDKNFKKLKSMKEARETRFEKMTKAQKAKRKFNKKMMRQIPELSLYHSIGVPEGAVFGDYVDFINTLNTLTAVEIAYAEPVTSLPQMNVITPDFTPNQGYFLPAPNGLDVNFAQTVAGGDGLNVSVIDIEYAFNANHEDLPAVFYNEGEFFLGFGTDHGTAVLGVIAALDNGIGITGIAPEAAIGFRSQTRNQQVAAALTDAAAQLNAGDIILIEAQRRTGSIEAGTNCSCAGNQCHLVAHEFSPAVFDATVAAVQAGIIVVSTAGNGSVNFDDPGFERIFDKSFRDSGAIMVGAGRSASRVPQCYSNYGSRIDVHAWGDSVYTLGYGNVFSESNTEDRSYTQSFGGTSAAGALIAGVSASIQGVAIANGLDTLDSFEMRTLLASTGTPQENLSDNQIGPMPNMRAAINNLLSNSTPSPTPTPSATPSTSPTPTITPTPIPTIAPAETTIQAESGSLLGSAQFYNDAAASGGQGVAFISTQNAGFSLSGVPAADQIRIRYASELSGQISVRVNGADIGNVSFGATGAWVGNYQTVSFDVAIPNNATFEIYYDNGDSALNADQITFVNQQTATPEPTSTPTPMPTVTPSPTPTIAPTSIPTPTVAPTAIPTVAPSPTPTSVPTASPSPTPTIVPTATPSPIPTATPTAEPTPTASPIPVTRGVFGLEPIENSNDAILYHENNGWTAGFVYLCLDSLCLTPSLNGNYYERTVNVTAGQSYLLEFKVQDNTIGQCLSGFQTVTYSENGVTAPSACD